MKSLILLASLVAMTACTTMGTQEAPKDSYGKETQNAILESTNILKK